jgi:hypothetical protein
MSHNHALRVLGILSRYRPRWLHAIPLRLSRLVQQAQSRFLRTRPVRMVTGALLGASYGAMTATVVGTVAASAWGIILGRAAVAELGTPLLLTWLVVIPVVALTAGRAALGIGAIVGVACAAVEGGIAVGLEWALVAGLGTAVGIALRLATWEAVGFALAFGGLSGGCAGVLTWLACTNRQSQPFSLKTASVYGAALVLIAGFVYALTG